MNWNAIGAIGEILGAVGVIASVLYLAVQIGRDREATLANTRQLRQSGLRETLLSLAVSNELATAMSKMGVPSSPVEALIHEYKLTREEATQVHAYYVTLFRQLETNLRMPMTAEEVLQTEDGIKAQLRGPGAIWWREAKKSTFSENFINRVNGISDGGT